MLHSGYPMLRLVCRWLLAGIFITLATLSSTGQDFAAAASQFAKKIVDRAPASSASIAIKNRSSLNAETVAAIRDGLLRQLQGRGWKLGKAEESDTSIVVTLAETARAYVWTAEINKAGTRDVAVFDLPRSREDGSASADRVVLSPTLLVSSTVPLLDAALLEGKIAEGTHLLALTPTSIQLYQLQSSQWHMVQSQPLLHDPIATRDLRGRIAPAQGDGFDAFLPGIHCTGAAAGALSANCRESDDPWPLTDDRRLLAFYAASRNYFTGVISGANAQNGNVNPFYSAAALNDGVVYAGIDGRQRFSLPGRHSSALAARWGSNIAALESSCQSELILASSPSDFSQGDSITAFRSSGADFNAVSEPIPFAGPVLSLKTSVDRQQSIAIVSSSSGRYEAYLLTARCGA